MTSTPTAAATVAVRSRRSTFGPIIRNELRLISKDPLVLVLLMAMPLVIISIFKSTMAASLLASGITGANGAEQVVPGQSLLFGFFLVSFIGLTFFREHGWGTWDRLRSSRASRKEIILGKALPWVIVGVIQVGILFTLGTVLFGLEIPGVEGVAAIFITAVCWMLFVGSFAVAMVALLPSIQLVSAVSNLGAMVFAAIGGALVPTDQLPGWARAVGPAVPTHWAMRSYDAILLEDRGLAGIVTPCLILLAFAACFAMIAIRRFRFNDVKTSFA